MNAENNKNGLKARRVRAYILLGIILCCLLFFSYRWYKNYTAFLKTDDAYLDADRVSVSSKILARIAAIHIGEGDTVHKGDVLVELDSTDLVAQKVQFMAAVAQAEAALYQAQARLELDNKSIRIQEISVGRAEEDFNRASVQWKGNVITKENYDHQSKNYETARAQLEVARAQINVSRSLVVSAMRNVDLAKAQVSTIQTQLGSTRIVAPVSGRIAKRWLLPGDIAAPAQSILTITHHDSVYVTAFFEETKISDIYLGKDVVFTVDAYPGVTFKGTVNYIATNTAGQFSLIPPSNASGNFTKVTQRIPVRMTISGSDNNGKYPKMKLMSGMSVYVKIPR